MGESVEVKLESIKWWEGSKWKENVRVHISFLQWGIFQVFNYRGDLKKQEEKLWRVIQIWIPNESNRNKIKMKWDI